MALKDVWFSPEFGDAFPMGLLLMGAVAPVTEFSTDRNAPKIQKQELDEEGNGTGRRLWKGTVIHAEHLGADTNLYLDCEKAGLLTVRIFGVFNAEPGATLYVTPDPARTYRFDADGRAIR